MMNEITQIDQDLLRQAEKKLSVRLELLNWNMQPIQQLEGQLADGSCTINASSDIRRTCGFTFHVKDSSYLVGENSKIWLDKFVRVSLGVDSLRTGETRWYPLGTYLLNENSFQFDTGSKSLTVQCLDLMSRLTGARGGQVGGMGLTIPENSSIRNAMITALSQLGFAAKHLVGDVGADSGTGLTPSVMQFSTGSTVYEIISKLRDLYTGWETYFDVNGTFVCQKIPTGTGDRVILDETTLNGGGLIISESRSSRFDQVKNVTAVWGKCITSNYFSAVCTLSGNVYQAQYDGVDKLADFKIFEVKVPQTNPAGALLQVNQLEASPLTNGKGAPLAENTLEPGLSYAFKYQKGNFIYLGPLQVHAVYKDENPDSPFNIFQPFGEILDVKSGGTFEKITSYADALARAKYENYLTTRLQDSVTLSLVLVPWLDVNQKIRYTSPLTGQTGEYLTKNISYSFKDGTMSVQAVRYYPSDPPAF